MEIILLVIVIAAVAGGAAWIAVAVPRSLARQNDATTAQLLAKIEQDRATTEQQRLTHEQALEARLLETQARVSQRQTEQFLELAKSHLKQESELGREALKQRQGEIDKGLDELRKELQNVREFVVKTDGERVRSIATVAEMVKESRSVTEALRQDTAKLNEALAGSQSRGQWGERIAEDVLRVAGFIEGVNYMKQRVTAEGNRPDFTFLLPDDRKLHMDVKMPMAAFKRYLDAPGDNEREQAAKEFLRDTKQRIKEVTSRDYINPDDGTLDYTLVFIPNEQVYGFIHERDPEIVDFALKQHVVICSPLTLFAVLAVIRQSLENFRLEARTKEIQAAIAQFRKQWEKYKEQLDSVGKSIDQTGRRWADLTGTRQRMLERHIEKVDGLRSGNDELAAAGSVEEELRELTGATEAHPLIEVSVAADNGGEADFDEGTVADDREPLF